MAQKSKTQRAKASAARAARKEQLDAAAAAEAAKAAETAVSVASEPKKSKVGKLFSKPAQPSADAKTLAKPQNAPEKTKAVEKAKPKKERFRFLKAVRAEMKRVTWPTRPEVIRWSIVVVAALLFFGLFVFVLDNWVVTPILVGIAGLGA